MSDLYKFTVDGSSILMFEDRDGQFRQEYLKLNQQISIDDVTGEITLTSQYSDHIEIETFIPTPDAGDDATLYVRSGESFTDLLGSPIVEPTGAPDDDYIDEDQDGDGSDDDSIDGTDDDDCQDGGRGNDDLYGLDGDDDLYGNQGDDYLVGGLGKDDLYGDVGFDALRGGSGADRLYGGDDDDTLKGDGGSDQLEGGTGNDQISGGNGNDIAKGGSGADALNGGLGDDVLAGGGGKDGLDGGLDDDKLAGGGGADDLDGGAGRDSLTGGAGGDLFIFDDGDFSGATSKSADHVVDFSHDDGDLVDLSLVDADTTLDGDQAFTFIGDAAFSSTAGELRFQQADGVSYLYGDQNGDGAADFAIRFDNAATIVVSDLVL
jgi:Ca2+-binding RTX toxin-like protein